MMKIRIRIFEFAQASLRPARRLGLVGEVTPEAALPECEYANYFAVSIEAIRSLKSGMLWNGKQVGECEAFVSDEDRHFENGECFAKRLAAIGSGVYAKIRALKK